MADFCTKCSEEMWEGDFGPDIDIQKIAESLESDSYLPVLCEGCGLRAVGKNGTGETILAVGSADDEFVEWIPKDQWEADWETKYKGF